MTIKKYLTTPEEVLALRDTDTKIYHTDKTDCYFKFVQGVLCYFCYDGSITVNVEMGLGGTYTNKYILAEEPVKEVTEEDIGKLCWFWDFHDEDKQVGVLVKISYTDSCPYRSGYTWYQHCRRLTPEEVSEIAGYKVEE